MLVLGLMSGTSADGVDAVLAEFTGQPRKPQWRLLNQVWNPYPKNLRNKVIAVGQGLRISSKGWLDLAESITEVHAQAAHACDPRGQFSIVGCHGQTVWHRPPTEFKRGASWQLIQAPLLAKLLMKPVVHDFRAADLAFGGQGAPLTPLLDEALIGRGGGWRAVLNLGGIANLSLIPPKTGPDRFHKVLGWDSGPANTLIDLAVQSISNGELCCDRDGELALSGAPNLRLIERWLKEPFFQLAPPKSTGREQFGRADFKKRFSEMSSFSKENLIATLTAFSAAAVAQDLLNLSFVNLNRPIELFVAGGGCKNLAMLKEIRSRCLGIRVLPIDEHGIPAQAREALAFALLAWWHVLRHPGNSPVVTGAQEKVVLGVRANPK